MYKLERNCDHILFPGLHSHININTNGEVYKLNLQRKIDTKTSNFHVIYQASMIHTWLPFWCNNWFSITKVNPNLQLDSRANETLTTNTTKAPTATS